MIYLFKPLMFGVTEPTNIFTVDLPLGEDKTRENELSCVERYNL